MLEADAVPHFPTSSHPVGRPAEEKPAIDNGLVLGSTSSDTGPDSDLTIFPAQSTANEPGDRMVLPGTSSATGPAQSDTFGLGMYVDFLDVDDQSTTPISLPTRDEVKTPSSGQLSEPTPKHEHHAGDCSSSFWASDSMVDVSVQDKGLDRLVLPSVLSSGSHQPFSA